MVQRGGGFEQRPDALPGGLLPPLSGQCGAKFNGDRPSPGRWLLPREEHPRVCERLNMLGNAVVPLQAHLAARLLQFEWRWALAYLRCRNEHFLGAAPRSWAFVALLLWVAVSSPRKLLSHTLPAIVSMLMRRQLPPQQPHSMPTHTRTHTHAIDSWISQPGGECCQSLNP